VISKLHEASTVICNDGPDSYDANTIRGNLNAAQSITKARVELSLRIVGMICHNSDWVPGSLPKCGALRDVVCRRWRLGSVVVSEKVDFHWLSLYCGLGSSTAGGLSEVIFALDYAHLLRERSGERLLYG
jgi:hypothetical protein